MTKIAVISDIHSNLHALDAVLTRIEERGCEKTYCLGDVVGYGARPNECIERLCDHNIISLQGNHDAVVSGLSSGVEFNEYAFTAAMQNRDNLTPASRDFLLHMAETIRVDDHTLMVHGSPAGRDHYLFGKDLIAHMSHLVSQQDETRLCFFGHTHDPCLWNGEDLVYREAEDYPLDPEICMMVNPGSVGQPRDGDNRAAFVFWNKDLQTLRFERVSYDVEAACQDIIAAGLPSFLGLRLRDGV